MSLYVSITPREAGALSLDTIADAINTLRYLDSEYRQYGVVDKLNMFYVEKSLAMVDAERSRHNNRVQRAFAQLKAAE